MPRFMGSPTRKTSCTSGRANFYRCGAYKANSVAVEVPFEGPAECLHVLLGHADVLRHEKVVVDDSVVCEVLDTLDPEVDEHRLELAEPRLVQERAELLLPLHRPVELLGVVQVAHALHRELHRPPQRSQPRVHRSHLHRLELGAAVHLHHLVPRREAQPFGLRPGDHRQDDQRARGPVVPEVYAEVRGAQTGLDEFPEVLSLADHKLEAAHEKIALRLGHGGEVQGAVGEDEREAQAAGPHPEAVRRLLNMHPERGGAEIELAARVRIGGLALLHPEHVADGVLLGL
mmetsp:Transcript_51341/g.116745  ORF Transcript_51341/g.116745 Transcript_51341/m.116745 type:complete len:288 (-) Transcript_51341:1987-2850(-)